MLTRIAPVLLAIFFAATSTRATEPKPFSGTPTQWQGFPRYDFDVDGINATVVVPDKPLPGRPWIWRGEFFGAFADADVALVKAGWHLAYLKVPDLFGSPKAIKHWERFYSAMVTEYGMYPKPGLIALSRGGLYCMNWAATHPDKTLAVYLDNAVCDFKSWPGGERLKLGNSKGSEAEWKKMLLAYDFKTDEEAIAYKLNPIDNLGPLAKEKIPLFLVYGDKDTVVPIKENSEIVFDRYKALGGSVERIIKPGMDHHPHGLTEVTPIVNFFTRAYRDDGNKVIREEIEWLDVWVPGNRKSTLPKVLLVGDSIVKGYFKEAEDQLKEKAVVCRLATSKSLGDPALIAEVQLVLSQTAFEVIHINNGLHGWEYSEEQYGNALPELLKTIRERAPKAKIVWATTTPVRVADKLDSLSDKTERVKKRNTIVAKLMARESIPIDDLFGVVADKPELYSRDGVHFNAQGTKALGKQVADAIRPLLTTTEKNKK